MKKMMDGTLELEIDKLEPLSEYQLDCLEWAKKFMERYEKREPR